MQLVKMLLIMVALFGTAACSPAGAANPPPSDPPATEANVVKGRVTDTRGNPVPGATISIAGYTGTGANVSEYVQTDANGLYRKPVPSGLYTVEGEATITFGGETFRLYLHPADDDCESQFSADGIVKDFTLRLTGLKRCLLGPDPNNYNSYSGGTVFMNHAFPRSLPASAELTFTLTPTGPLLDGGVGETLTFTRPASAVDGGYSDPLETTMYLHDIPVGTYRIAGTVTLPDGSRQALRFGPYLSYEPADTYEFGFEAVRMYPYGIRVTNLDVYDPEWAGR
jgi:hypothetical protein